VFRAVADVTARAARIARHDAAPADVVKLRALPVRPVVGAIAARPNTADMARPDAEVR
jgi:hypothetical protein